jgi:hypothetical protein
VCVLLAADLARRRDADAVLLALWVLGTFVFASFVNYTTNGRALLPLVPPVAILLGRQIAARRGDRPLSPALRYAPLLPGFALALLVAWGDASIADASRVAARYAGATHGSAPGTLWFEGQWGFQYYMRQVGARQVDVRRNVLRPGDALVSHTNSTIRLGVSPQAATLVDVIEIPAAWVTTMALDTATGFYAIQWGPLPYRFRPGYAERFEVRRIDRFVMFETDPQEIERRRRELRSATGGIATLLAIHSVGWASVEPPESEPDAGAGWARCTPAFQRLGAAVSDRCLWCASVEECGRCIGAEAARAGADVDCARLLDTALREQALRCDRLGGAGEQHVCGEAQRIYRSLMGELDR